MKEKIIVKNAVCEESSATTYGVFYCDFLFGLHEWSSADVVPVASQVGYAQGMNDVLSMVLDVLDSEATAYTCFAKYLETIQADFMAHGMMEKLGTHRTCGAVVWLPQSTRWTG